MRVCEIQTSRRMEQWPWAVLKKMEGDNQTVRATCPAWAMYLYTIRINNIKMVQTRTYTQKSYNDVVFVFLY